MPINDVVRGNIPYDMILNVTLSPSSVANATSAEQTFAVAGLQTGDYVSVSKPTAQAGLGIVNARVSGAGVLAITFMNATAATITPTASEVYVVNVCRPYTNPPSNMV